MYHGSHFRWSRSTRRSHSHDPGKFRCFGSPESRRALGDFPLPDTNPEVCYSFSALACIGNHNRTVTPVGICSEDVQRHEFTIIIDMRSSTWSNTKVLLRNIQETFPASIRVVYVVKPDDFHHRPKAGPGGQPKYGFEVRKAPIKYFNIVFSS